MATFSGTRSRAAYTTVRPRAGRAAFTSSVATRTLLRMSPQRRARIVLGAVVVVAAMLGAIVGTLLSVASS
jgi:hypothetical protein